MTGSGFLEFGYGFSQDPRVRKTQGSMKTGKAMYYLRNTQGSNISSNIDTILLLGSIDNTPLAYEIILHSSSDLVSEYSSDVRVFLSNPEGSKRRHTYRHMWIEQKGDCGCGRAQGDPG